MKKATVKNDAKNDLEQKIKLLDKKVKDMEEALKMLYMVTGKIAKAVEEKISLNEQSIKLAPLNPEDYKKYIG